MLHKDFNDSVNSAYLTILSEGYEGQMEDEVVITEDEEVVEEQEETSETAEVVEEEVDETADEVVEEEETEEEDDSDEEVVEEDEDSDVEEEVIEEDEADETEEEEVVVEGEDCALTEDEYTPKKGAILREAAIKEINRAITDDGIDFNVLDHLCKGFSKIKGRFGER